jgi:hypothetical protein
MLFMRLCLGLVSSSAYVAILLSQASIESGQRIQHYDLRGLVSSAESVKCCSHLLLQQILLSKGWLWCCLAERIPSEQCLANTASQDPPAQPMNSEAAVYSKILLLLAT